MASNLSGSFWALLSRYQNPSPVTLAEHHGHQRVMETVEAIRAAHYRHSLPTVVSAVHQIFVAGVKAAQALVGAILLLKEPLRFVMGLLTTDIVMTLLYLTIIPILLGVLGKIMTRITGIAVLLGVIYVLLDNPQ